jgi:hypothetical protein
MIMKKYQVLNIIIFFTIILLHINCNPSNQDFQTISIDELRNKIAGGWAGKMIGVSYGGPTEFQYNGIINEDSINWNPEDLRNSIGEDDLYVQMSFMMTMDEFGIDAPVEKFGEAFANAGYMLFHANRKARKNIWDGIKPPLSGHPDYNLHADDIDFQIEADYIGLMSPGMPQTSNEICDKIGHIMNYGDGVYGGMFVSALYAAAYFEDDINNVLKIAMKSLPAESHYYKILIDVISGYDRNPDDWTTTWNEIYDKWGNNDICCALSEFNIDAKLNGAFIAMGLLYGEGDFEKSMEISTRCGADSDCNPSNCAGVMGIILGYDNIPNEWTQYIDEIADSTFIYTNYSFNKAIDRTLHYAKELIVKNGGKVEDGICYIIEQKPTPAKFEQSFSNISPKYKVTINDDGHWAWKGNWEIVQEPIEWGYNEPQMQASENNSEMVFKFSGTGAVIYGRYDKDCGIADVFVDDEYTKTIDNYYYVMEWGAGDGWLNGAHLFHVLGLSDGEHTIKFRLNGKKNSKSLDTKIKIARAIVYE